MTNPYQAPKSNIEQVDEGSNTKSTVRYAGFWARAVATAIDSIIWLVISLPALYFIYGSAYFEQGIDSPIIYGFADAMISWILPIIIVLIFWRIKQATPGKIMLKMKVVDAKTGLPPSTWQLLIRYFGYILSALIFLLGFFWTGWDKKKQAWHDKIAGTMVIFFS